MILNTEVNTVESNMKVTSAKFGIANMSKVFEIFQNHIYSNKKQTIVQEYMCNGRDANREVQTKTGQAVRPIEVTVPSAFSLAFKVRDFGPGISEERMYTVFINYGASTKTNTNTQTGGFGIGAKSAFAYTTSFLITTFIDGVKTCYIADIGETKEGDLRQLSQGPTDEPNGTEISIPVQKQDVQDFINATVRAGYFWSEAERPVVKNLGEFSYHDWKYQIGETTISNYLNSYNDNGFYLIVDGIIYPIQNLVAKIDKDHESLMKNFKSMFKTTNNIFIQVPNGKVGVSASREQVEDSKMTFEYLIPVLKENFLQVQADYESKKTFPSFEEALEKGKSVSAVYRMNRFKVGNWNLLVENNDPMITSSLLDKVIITHMGINDKGDFREVKLSKRDRWKHDSTLKKVDHSNYVKGNLVHLDNCDEAQVIVNRKLKQYLQKNGLKSLFVFKFLTEMTDAEKDEVISTLKLKAVKDMAYDKQIVLRERKVIDKSLYPLYVYTSSYNKDVKNYTAEELAKFEKIVYVPFDKIGSMGDTFNSFSRYYPKTLFVGATKASLKKLESLSNAISYKAWEPTIKVEESEIKGYIWKQIKDNNFIHYLCPMAGVESKAISDLKALISPYENQKLSANLPALHTGKILNDKNVAIVLQSIWEQVKIVKETYPLLSKISLGHFSQNEESDLVTYLNSK